MPDYVAQYVPQEELDDHLRALASDASYGTWETMVAHYAAVYGVPCEVCDGRGKMRSKTFRSTEEGGARIDRIDCPECNGTGRIKREAEA